MIDVQRLRNLTTRRLHTKVDHIYQDIERLTGMNGVMTHQIPRIMRAMDPWLRRVVTDPRFWDGEYDTTHVGKIDVPVMNEAEQKECVRLFLEQPNPLVGKEVIVVETGKESDAPTAN